MKIIVTTNPFGDPNSTPRRQLEDLEVSYNETGRKYTKDELIGVIKKYNPDIIIAGTENYNSEILDMCSNLKMISRVGIGLDSVDLDECSKRGIIVTNTPDAPTNAVSELTICNMLNCLRRIPSVSNKLQNNIWNRFIGKEIRSCEIGIIGFGRIGSNVARKLDGLKPRRIFINDIDKSKCQNVSRCEFESKLQIICHCDIITLHIPYNKQNHNFISKQELSLMKEDAILINTSRGNIVNELDLYNWLIKNPSAMAAIDTFESEPYTGNFQKLDNVLLTPHLGSCTLKSRFDMEVGATEEVMNFINKKPFNNRVV